MFRDTRPSRPAARNEPADLSPDPE